MLNTLNNITSTISNLIGNPLQNGLNSVNSASTTQGLSGAVDDAGGGTDAFSGYFADMQKDALKTTQQQAQMTKFQNQVNLAQTAIQIMGKLEKSGVDKMNIM